MQRSTHIQFIYRMVLVFFLLSSLGVQAQHFNSFRTKKIIASSQQLLDTLSLVPGSMRVLTSAEVPLDTACYTIQQAHALLRITCAEVLGQTLTISYRVFPFSLSKTYSKRMLDSANKNIEIIRPYAATKEETEWMNFGSLSKQGSISREFSLGNTRDAAMNSDLNLQLNGRLSDQVFIRAAITDKNIPVQPDGYTQQIQEFDRMYLELLSKRNSFTGGDFVLTEQESYFMKLSRKARGGLFCMNEPLTQKDSTRFRIIVKGSGSVSKGKYSRITITPVEGVQGPYRLSGQDNALYIVVLAGSEKIYLDGVLLKRGEEYDYTIDYNTAELTFTVKQPVTKDKRIVAEFEYADKKYARSMFYNALTLQMGKWQTGYSLFSEQDMKNQPLLQELTSEQKYFLSGLPSTTEQAWYPGFQEVDYNENEVLYALHDTVIAGIYYDSIFVFSVNQDSAKYRLNFTHVGQGNGHYVLQQSIASGRVYAWVAPLAGIPQGSYEPVVQLTAPQKQQVLSTFAAVELGRHTKARFEWSMSHLDNNTFSDNGPTLRKGFAARMMIENNSHPWSNDSIWTLRSGLTHEWVNPYYSPAERFRAVEYERDWALGAQSAMQDEFLTSAYGHLSDVRRNVVSLNTTARVKGEDYLGIKHQALVNATVKSFRLQTQAGLMQSKTTQLQTNFVRQNTTLSKRIGAAEIGLHDQLEQNTQTLASSDTLTASSFQFNEYELFVADADSTEKRFKLFYKNRLDRLPGITDFTTLSSGQSVGTDLRLASKKYYRASLTAAYRSLSYAIPSAQQQDDNSFVGRTEHAVTTLKGALLSQTYYETGSSMELKKEYRYLLVPAGQGVYSWTDYNQNGVKELDEFNTAVYRDQANYIRVYTPTNVYIRANMSSVSEMLDFNPALRWPQARGLANALTKLSTKTTASFNKKTTEDASVNTYLPFLQQLQDTSVLSMNSTFRNTLFINRNATKFGSDIIYDRQMNKMLQMNGFDFRQTEAWTLVVRGCVKQRYYLKLQLVQGVRQDSSAYLVNRNYKLNYHEAEPSFTYQPGMDYRFVFGLKYTERRNVTGGDAEQAYLSKAYTDMTLNILKNGSLQSRIELVKIVYTATENSSLAYIMLDGLKSGYNLTWNLAFQKDIASNLQLNLIYDGRKMPASNIIHIGSLMLRAYF